MSMKMLRRVKIQKAKVSSGEDWLAKFRIRRRHRNKSSKHRLPKMKRRMLISVKSPRLKLKCDKFSWTMTSSTLMWKRLKMT